MCWGDGYYPCCIITIRTSMLQKAVSQSPAKPRQTPLATQDTATLQATNTNTTPQSTNSPAASLLWERLHRTGYTTTDCVHSASRVRSTDISLRRFRPFSNRLRRSTSQHVISRLACNLNGPPTCRVVHRVTFDSPRKFAVFQSRKSANRQCS